MARTKDFDEEQVLKEAICLFSHKGYTATSMQDVVNTLGLSRSSLYDTFGDKRQLYIKALKSYEQQNVERLNNLMSNADSMKAAIRMLLEMLVMEWLNDEQQKGCFMTNAGMEMAPHDPEVNTLVCKFEQRTEEVLIRAVTKGQESGEISNKQPALLLARFLVNTIKGLQVAVKSNKIPSFFEEVIQVALTVLD